jgi:hypothetical protein
VKAPAGLNQLAHDCADATSFLAGDRLRQRSLPDVGDPGHAVQMALADITESRSVDPLDRGDICPGGVYGALGTGHEVQQNQVTGHDQPVAAYRL